ncbi:MAG TPA: WD40 repeat domain-containing protein [Myxococcaceae bacterium]|jgi:WD40 repeat protein
MIELGDPDVPFRELFPYYERDAHYFFGRDADSRILIANLLASRVTVAFGASGAGKSSVLRAGVMAQIHKMADARRARGSPPEVAAAIVSSWSGDPRASLRQAIAEGLKRSGAATLPDMGAADLRVAIGQCAEALDDDHRGQLLIILDQFEEYFLYHPAELVRGSFAAELAELIADPELPASVLIALREDAIGKLDAFKGGIPDLFKNLVRVEPLEREAAGDAILKTVETFNRLHGRRTIEVEPELVRNVLDQVQIGSVQVGDAAGLAPSTAPGVRRVESTFLQLVMTRVWKEEARKGSDRLTARTLQDLGKAENIVREHVDSRISALSSKRRDGAAEVLGYLVTSGGAKISYTAAALAERTGLPAEEIKPILEALSAPDTRILRRDNDTYELFHDVLAGVVLDWRRRHRAEQHLAQAKRRAEEAEAGERRQRAATRRLMLAVGALVGGALVTIAAYGKLVWTQADLDTERKLSFSRELTANAEKVLEADPQLSLLLIKQAASIQDTAQVRDALAAYGAAPRRSILRHSDPVMSAVFSPDGKRIVTASRDDTACIWDAGSGKRLAVLSGHTGWVWSAAFSPDGQRVLTASLDNTARLWDAASGRQLAVLSGHPLSLLNAAFSPDGLRAVTASVDQTARVWDLASGRPIAELRGHTHWVQGAVFSPDGLRVLTASHDKTARVWDAASGRPLVTLSGHGNWVQSAAFSPDGQRVLTASSDNTARLWDAVSGKQFAVLSGHTGSVLSASFSADGRRLLTASSDNSARVWDAGSGKPLVELRHHSGSVVSAVFSPDGQRVLTASSDSTALIWDATSGRLLAELRGHSSPVLSATFSPDGRSVLTASFDNTARIWDAASEQRAELRGSDLARSAVFSPDTRRVLTTSFGSVARVWDVTSGERLSELRGHDDWVWNASFSSNGLRVLTASRDGTARLWSVASGEPIATLTGHSGWVRSAAFSSDGQRIVTAGDDNTARVWDASGTQLAVLSGHTDWVRSATFSPDGRRVLTASRDGSARLWEADSGNLLVSLAGHTSGVNAALFSGDGQRVLTASDDHTARFWDAASGKQLLELRGHTSAVLGAKLSPDGRRVLTASSDDTARLWDASSGKQLTVLLGHSGGVRSAAFSPDGRRVLTASADNTARIWDTGSGEPVAEFRGHADLLHAVFSSDGRSALTIGRDGIIRNWDIAEYGFARLLAHDPGRDFTCAERREYLHEDVTCPEP